ncbi:MAG: radical SAM protein [Thermoproteales archaeon]|nr:radical SAM protein [Thermoproteales archaeon]
MKFREENRVFKDPRRVDLRICIVYPNEYKAGVSTLAVQILYFLFNSFENVYCERFFYEKGGEPLSIETKTPLKEFDVLAFTLHYELDYPRAIAALIDSGVNVKGEMRGPDEPIVIAGGPAVTQNPLPLKPFFDAFFIGEVEEEGIRLLEALLESRLRSLEEKRRILDPLTKVRGLYVPSIMDNVKVERVYVKNLDHAFYPIRQVIPLDEEQSLFGPAFYLEIGRGCGWGCRFCLSGYIYRPPRFRSLTRIFEILRLVPGFNKHVKRVVLISFAAGDHPNFKEILNKIIEEGYELSIPSLRADVLDAEALGYIIEGGQKTLTIAPEVGTMRLAKMINKKLYPEYIKTLAKTAFKEGVKKIKLYFMIGLPTETIEDVKEIGELINYISSIGFSKINVSVTPFIPKPHTPLQWEGMQDIGVIKEKYEILAETLKSRGRVELKIFNPEVALIEGAVSKGDNRLSEVILRVALARRFGLQAWRKAFSEAGLRPEYYAGRRIPLDEKLPWSFIDTGVREDFLKKEYERFFLEEESPACYSMCSGCMTRCYLRARGAR